MKHLTFLALGKFKAAFVDRVDAILELVTGADVNIVRVKGNDNHWTDKELRDAVTKTEHYVEAFGDFHLDGVMMFKGGNSVQQVTRYLGDISGNDDLHTALVQWGDFDSDHVFTISPNRDAFIDVATVFHDWLI